MAITDRLSIAAVTVSLGSVAVAWFARRDARRSADAGERSAAASERVVALTERQYAEVQNVSHRQKGPTFEQVDGAVDLEADQARVRLRIVGGPARIRLRIRTASTVDHPITVDGKSLGGSRHRGSANWLTSLPDTGGSLCGLRAG